MHDPSVSPLEFTNEHGHSQFIASGWSRETDDDRAWKAGATPATATAEQHDPHTLTTEPHPTDDTGPELPF